MLFMSEMQRLCTVKTAVTVVHVACNPGTFTPNRHAQMAFDD